MRHLRGGERLFAPLLALLLFGGVGPDPYPKDYFRSPLGIPLVLAGSFAEMRANHFHSGLDIKTNGSTGYRVYSAADGWIARVSISAAGFGNALYVEHPNGFMTVYGHLDRFSPEITEYITKLQYARESFTVDAFPTRGRFPVSKGDVIAFSGNTGSSGGPHLHFEIRDVKTGQPDNPLLFGLEVADTQPPRIQRVKMYALDAASYIRVRDAQNGGWRYVEGNDAVLLDVTTSNGVYRLSRADSIEAFGRIGFGIQTYDNHNGSHNRLGAYRIDLSANGDPIYDARMESFAFGQTRYINAHVDYAEYVEHRRWIQRSFLLPGNRLPFYTTMDRGVLYVDADGRYGMEYRVTDAYGNESVLPFQVVGAAAPDETLSQAPTPPEDDRFFVRYDRPYGFDSAGISVRMPSGVLYANVRLHFELLDTSPGGVFGPVYRFHDDRTPVQDAFSVSLDGSAVPERLRSRAGLALVESNGRLSWAGGSWKDGKVRGSVRTFGDFTIAADTTAPEIRPLNIADGRNLAASDNIRFRIGDDFSGIRSFRAEVDGNWALFAYDAKSGTLRHTFDGHVSRGSHRLVLKLTDGAGNEAVYEADFSR